MSVQQHAFFHAPTFTVTYLVWDVATGQAAVIDPALDFDAPSGRLQSHSADAVLAFAAERDLSIVYVLETHAHADHLSAADQIRRATGATVVIGDQITRVQSYFAEVFDADDVTPDGSAFGRLAADGDRLALGETEITVLHTPGHTPACVTYLIGDAAFVGDTLFMPDYGTARADFPGGDAATLYRSIRRILDLPPETRVFVGHDYLSGERKAHAWETSVAEERAKNIHVHDGVSEAEFVARREARDATLAAPNLLLPSLQVNIRGGRLPPSENGKVFLRLPVSVSA